MYNNIEEKISEMAKSAQIGYPCPDCGEYGGVFPVRNMKTGLLCGYCDECDTLWKTPEDKFKEKLKLADFEWGGYATVEEVEAFGWSKYIV